jgi:Na+-transporting NADH:ubiquinone oxidoreductase subunit NqrB
MTIPNDKRSRIIWASSIAVVSFILTTFFQIYTAGIWVLFFFTPITILLDKWRPSQKYQWFKTPSRVDTSTHIQSQIQHV